MNGRLKCLFHGRSKCFHQLLFNIDVRQMLHFVHTLAKVESVPTIDFLQSSSSQNMVQIDPHTYILGQSKLVEATEEQKSLLDTDGPIEVFYMRGSTYTSKSYARGISGKRNDSFQN